MNTTPSQPFKSFTRFLTTLSLIPVLIFAGMATAPTSFYTVEANEMAVVMRFGQYHRTTGPGLHLKWPWDFESVYKVPVLTNLKMEFGFRTQKSDVKTTYAEGDWSNESLMLTGDLGVVDVSWIIQYQISSAKDYLFNVRNVDENLKDLSVSVMREVIGDHTANECISEARDKIAEQAFANMQSVLDSYKMGITLVALELQDVIVAENVKNAFDNVNKAVQDAKQTTNIAKREREKRIKEALGEADQAIKMAEAEKISTINRAKGDASRYKALLLQFASHPELTKSRLYYEELSKIVPKADSLVIVDSNIKTLIPTSALGVKP